MSTVLVGERPPEVDADARTVEWFTGGDSGFRPEPGSELLGISAIRLSELVDRPV